MMCKTFFTFVLPEVGFAIHYLEMYAKYGLGEMNDHIVFYYEDPIDKDVDGYHERIDKDAKSSQIEADIKQCLDTIHSLNYCLIDYLQGESKSYQNYFRNEVSPKYTTSIKALFANKDLELNIFKEEYDADLLHDVYMALEAMGQILENQESLIADNSDLKRILSYNLSILKREPKPQMLGMGKDVDNDEPVNLHDALNWNGTPAELAYLFSSLADNGYITPPGRRDGNRNNAAFARQIYSHINILNGSFDTLVNNLKDNRIAANNQFKLAMDRLPKLNKSNK